MHEPEQDRLQGANRGIDRAASPLRDFFAVRAMHLMHSSMTPARTAAFRQSIFTIAPVPEYAYPFLE